MCRLPGGRKRLKEIGADVYFSNEEVLFSSEERESILTLQSALASDWKTISDAFFLFLAATCDTMRYMVRNLSFKTKSAVMVLMILPALLIPLFFIVQNTTKSVFAISEDENFRRIFHIIQWEMEDELEYVSILLKRIASDSQVQDMIIQNDRDGLYRHLVPEYELFKDKVFRYHIHSAEGKSILRVHNPELEDDDEDLTAIRPMVEAMVERQAELRGIEKGREGFSLRVMTPVFKDGEFIGSIEFGMDFLRFLEKITDRYCGDFHSFELTGNGSFSQFSSTETPPAYTPSVDEIRRIESGESYWLKPEGEDYSVGILPFNDFQGNVAGFFQVELCRISIADQIGNMRDLFVGLTIITITSIVSMLFLFVRRNLVRPLQRVVEQIQRISKEITSGNLNYRGNVDETGVDFRAIIKAINQIIANLRERETVLRAIIDGFPGIVFYLDHETRILWANARAKTTGEGEILGRQLSEATSSNGFFKGERELLEETFRKKHIASRSICYMRDNGDGMKNECWEHLSIPILDEDNHIRNILRISSDITDKLEAETALKRMNETLEKRVESEVLRRKEQEELAYQQSRMAAIGELAAGIAHEINQPLNSISFAIQNVYNRYVDGSIDSDYFKKKIDGISGDIARTRRIIDHVRIFARESSAEYNILFPINQSVRSAISLIGVQLATLGIDVRLQLDEDLPQSCGNPFRYEQVVLNLISNAKDALEERKRLDSDRNDEDPLPLTITVSTFRRGDSIVLEVLDNGSGIAKELLGRVFDPFFTTKSAGKGTGLGLSISYGIVKELGGSIDIHPQNQGTLVSVSIPVGEKICEN